MSPGLILEITNLRRRFGGVNAVDGVDLAIRRHAITGLIGPNGAGKTTLFNLIAGTVKPDHGSIRFDGRNVTGWAPDALAIAGLTRTFQLARGLGEMTVLENFALYGQEQPGERLWRALLRGPTVRDREAALIRDAWEVIGQLNLAHVANHRVADLSGGQKKLVELGRALMGRPKLLLLNEPMAGVNPALAAELAERLLAIREQGVTILVIEHNMSFVDRVCDVVVVMAGGKVLTEGSFEHVRANETVQLAYLGHTA